MKKYILLFVFIAYLCSCSTTKRTKLLKMGRIEQTSFYQQVSFERRAGLPVIQATINGHVGMFLFDTGAPNVLSKSFATKLGLKSRAKGNVNDSGGNTLRNQSYVRVDKIEIGNLSFLNTGAIVQNLGRSEPMACLGLDGIIGGNLMRKAFWKIDYQNQVIEVSDDPKKFELSDEVFSLPFRTKTQGTPIVDIELDGIGVKNLTFDTGSNGHIAIPTKGLKTVQIKNVVDYTFSVGSTSYGVGGKSQTDTTFYAIIDEVKLGSYEMKDKVIHFRPHGDVIGNKFLENFDIILDWESNQIFLQEIQAYDYNSLENFGFKLDWNDGGMFVGVLFEGSDAIGKLEIGDQVLKLNEYDFEHMTTAEICDIFRAQSWSYKDADQVELKVNREGQIHRYILEKKALLPTEIIE